MLPQNDEYTFSCVLSSLNLAKWDEMEDEDIFWSIIFLDCVVSETLEQTKGIGDIEKLHNFTRDFRALGLGTLGWHTYLQSKMLTMDSLQAKLLNKQIFARINKVAQQATRHLYDLNGAPKYCKDLGIANATLLAIAPNTSSALLAGGMSQGIEPLAANTYNQNTAAGEVTRMNPTLIKHLKDIGHYSEQLVEDLQVKHQGSIQSLDFLNDHVKRVFATANEIDQNVLVNLAADRQPNICQGQSLNLTFNGTEQEIATVTKRALNNPHIKSLYYQRSIRSVRASSGECLQCEG